MNKTMKYLGILFAAALLAVGIGFVLNQSKPKTEKTSQEKTDSKEDKNIITYNGQKYKYNSNMKAILFLGVDKNQEVNVGQTPGYGGQADTILLYVVDKEKETSRKLTISRDTMTDIQLYDVSGDKLARERAQLALQYAYGASDKKSCRLMETSVSELLYGIPISDYFCMTMEGIPKVVDALGGVEMTMPEDFTFIDPSFAAGSTVTLSGKQAETFVRYRDTGVTGSNNARMERQNLFLSALMSRLSDTGAVTKEVYGKLMEQAEDYFVTNMTADELFELSEYKNDGETLNLPGETVAGAEHDEYIVDDENLREIVLKLFYKSI